MNDNKFNLSRSGVNHINDLGFFTAQMPNRLEDSRRSGHSITSLLVPLAVKRNKLNPRYYFSQIFFWLVKFWFSIHLNVFHTCWDDQSNHTLRLDPAFAKSISYPRWRAKEAFGCNGTNVWFQFVSKKTQTNKFSTILIIVI